MPLTPETRLGSYEIVAPVGAGGMGEVYRARDTKLNRDVAIKVLPELFARDADRLMRFEREAQALAAVNHPNIAQVFGVLEAPAALVMEFVDGEDLSQRIGRGPVPLEETLPIARQIAEALEAAHEHGIVHRDLKPANIKVRPDGTVKVLDFGLAKAMDPAAAVAAPVMNSPTFTSPAMTQMGVILGTAAYMAPEQARGKAVDKRADIWAFGLILHEMLTGRPMFSGEDASDVLAAVLRQEIEWQALPDATPAGVRRLLERCLDRDPKQRLRDIGEARVALAAPVAADAAATLPRRSGSRWREPVAWITAAAAVAALLVGAPWRRSAPAPREGAVALTLGLTGGAWGSPAPVVSPDGRSLLSAKEDERGVMQLWLRAMDSFAERPVRGTSGLALPVSVSWSPDGEHIAFVAERRLKRLSLSGGSATILADQALARGVAWTRGGSILFTQARQGAGFMGPLSAVAATGGPVTTVTATTAGSHRWPSALPQPHRFLFTASPQTGHEGVHVGTVGSTETRLLLPEYSGAAYAAGYLLHQRGDEIVAQPFDLERLALHGKPTVLVDGVGGRSTIGLAAFSATDSALVYVTTAADLELVSISSTGAARTLAALPRSSNFALSPDDRKVAYVSSSDEVAGTDIWVRNLDDGTSVRLSRGPEFDNSPAWSADGQRIAFRSDTRILLTPAAGGGTFEDLLREPLAGLDALGNWTPDGAWLLAELVNPESRRDLYLVDVKTRQARPLLVTPASERNGSISPDGQWLAYVSDVSGAEEVYVQALHSGTPRQVSSGGGGDPLWSADGATLYFASRERVFGVRVLDRETLQLASPELLVTMPSLRDYAPVADGSRFLVTRWTKPSEIRMLLNWTELLKR
ncbi:MAG TPA: protein kinase [Vicinamibacterales bacterium]|nr:protein kinase [Vicinamibacterales bacterium]